MAHFQERRTGADRRQYKDTDRRINAERRRQDDAHNPNNVEFIERARHKAWLAMTDKSSEN